MKPVTTPMILQMEVGECGAAALAIVLAHFGRWVPLEELRVACGVSREGSKAGNIARAARRYGLTAEGHRHQPEALPSLPLPMIAHWNVHHFVIVEGFGKECVYLNDPATGPRSVSHEEFVGSFTGIVLVCQPGPDFRPGGAKPSVAAALRERLRGWGRRQLLRCYLGRQLLRYCHTVGGPRAEGQAIGDRGKVGLSPIACPSSCNAERMGADLHGKLDGAAGEDGDAGARAVLIAQEADLGPRCGRA
jgi:hypothetical protein